MRKIAVLFILTAILFAAAVAPAGAQGGWMVVSWAGDLGELPEGWQVCDGSNGTPDLQNAFLVGAGDEYALAATGGSATVNLNHRHTVDAHSHTISTADLSHTHVVGGHSHYVNAHNHSIPAHSHTISSADLAHTHSMPSHNHSISSANIDHIHNIASEAVGGSNILYYWVGWGVAGSPTRLGAWNAGSPGSTYSRALNYTTGMSTNTTHNHGSVTGDWSGTSGAMSANGTHAHGGATGNWNGTTGNSSGVLTDYYPQMDTGAMSANGTHAHGGTTGSITTTMDYQLTNTNTLPPYYAVYYACAPGSALGITATAMITDPMTTDYYTTTTGMTYSRVRTVDTGTEITNYLLIAIVALVALQVVLWFITEAKRKWN